jgi:hypothetical protein
MARSATAGTSEPMPPSSNPWYARTNKEDAVKKKQKPRLLTPKELSRLTRRVVQLGVTAMRVSERAKD